MEVSVEVHKITELLNVLYTVPFFFTSSGGVDDVRLLFNWSMGIYSKCKLFFSSAVLACWSPFVTIFRIL